jgi:hypothetical protein
MVDLHVLHIAMRRKTTNTGTTSAVVSIGSPAYFPTSVLSLAHRILAAIRVFLEPGRILLHAILSQLRGCKEAQNMNLKGCLLKGSKDV